MLRERTVPAHAVVHKAWPGFNLKPDGITEGYSNNVKTLRCDYPQEHDNNYPFANALAQYQLDPLNGGLTTIASDGGWVGQAWVLARIDPSSWSGAANAGSHQAQLPTNPSTNPPTYPFTDYIYGQFATGHGLQYGAYQYQRVWWRNTYNPPGWTFCTGIPTINSFALPPPNIGLPPT
jgi:hypothetical protein